MAPFEPTVDQQPVIDQLKTLFADDRLTMDEYADRVGLVLASQSRAELDQAVEGLPVSPTASAPLAGSRPSPTSTIISVFGGNSRVGRWRLPSRVRVLSLFGGTKLDLRQASTDAADVTIVVVTLFGSVEAIVPEGVDVQLSGVSLFGGRDADIAPVPVLPGAPTIHVRAFVLFGSTTVVSKPRER
jgi:hypothetical protein